MVEARDFTLVIDKLPDTFRHYTDELGLKRGIWAQIQKIVQHAIDKGICPGDTDPSIVSISFARNEVGMLQMQRESKL